jgi:hypothetical protein
MNIPIGPTTYGRSEYGRSERLEPLNDPNAERPNARTPNDPNAERSERPNDLEAIWV